MKKLFAPLLVALAALCLLAGCGSSTDIITSGLRANLVGLNRTASGDIKVTWRVRNPNVVPYVLGKASLKISLAGTPVGTVTDDSRLGVPSLNQIEQTGTLVPAGPGAVAAIDRAIAAGSAAYTLEANLWMVMEEEKLEKFRLLDSGIVPATAK